MDLKLAFLNGHIQKDIFMEQPQGFESKEGYKVCKLKKSIYILKKGSRSWNIMFDEVNQSFGFMKNVDEPCLHKKAGGSATTFFILYVDGI